MARDSKEMKLLLQSALAMDKHSADNSQYYKWELHIFFDDAFTIKNNKYCVNTFVLELFEAMREVHQDKIDFLKELYETDKPFQPEAKMETTEYGGQVTWTLEQGSEVICHLKNKKLIRHKKRWSQCMYIEYFRLRSDKRVEGVTADEIEIASNNLLKSQNTFLLALDGDVVFEPKAVTLLLDVMIKNRGIGAACGRINPTGSGVIAGYQKFEYAVGHWLQKSTEDALGNVLCSPGCFSLFRLQALCENKTKINLGKFKERMKKKGEDKLEENMKKYRKSWESMKDLQMTSIEKYFTKATTARQSIQFDQGEDRWLCTLLITRGWEVSHINLVS